MRINSNFKYYSDLLIIPNPKRDHNTANCTVVQFTTPHLLANSNKSYGAFPYLNNSIPQLTPQTELINYMEIDRRRRSLNVDKISWTKTVTKVYLFIEER